MLVPFQIILYNSSRFIPKLLKSFAALELGEHRVEIRFRDQSPEQTEVDLSRKVIEDFDFPDGVGFAYSQGKNLGFGAGHNRINSELGNGEDFFIINPDGMVMFDFVTQFMQFLTDHESNEWAILEASQFPAEHPKRFDPESFETKWSSGACCYINADFFKEVGGFDENIFMYCEDVDLSFAARSKNLQILHMPQVKFVHITQDLDAGKDRTFERIHSQAGSLYLRHKWATMELVDEYDSLIVNQDGYAEVRKLFESMSAGVGAGPRIASNDLNDFFVGTEFAEHRW